ncbi:phage holin family protein [Blautia sp.]
MKEFWNFIQMVFMAVGGWLGWFMGGCDGLLYVLIAFVVIDYLTGVMCAFADHTLSSEVGFRGICRKVLIFLLVGMANILDVAVIGNGSVLRTAVIFFYISNEGVKGYFEFIQLERYRNLQGIRRSIWKLSVLTGMPLLFPM